MTRRGRMRLGLARLLMAGLSGCLWAAPAAAQAPLEDVLSFLLTNQSIPTGDFVRDEAAAEATREAITRLLLVELTTVPLSSSSAGFAYRFNPAIGTVERASDSFGPFFTERSLTAGRDRATAGVNVRFARYTSLDGHDLTDGSFITTANQFRDEPVPFDVEALTLEIEATTVTVFGNYGVTDWLDVGAAIPVVSVSLEGSRLNTYRGAQLLQASAIGEATGLGDVSFRSKVRLLDVRGGGLALLGEVRMPTGREEDLLGAGTTSYRGYIIGSVEPGRFAAHVNAGFAGGGVADEVQYRAAVGMSVTPSLTLVGELLGRRISDLGALTEQRAPHPIIEGVETLRLVTSGDSTHAAAVVTGLKWNVAWTWLLNASVSVPVTERGLRPAIVALVGLEYGFGQ